MGQRVGVLVDILQGQLVAAQSQAAIAAVG